MLEQASPGSLVYARAEDLAARVHKRISISPEMTGQGQEEFRVPKLHQAK